MFENGLPCSTDIREDILSEVPAEKLVGDPVRVVGRYRRYLSGRAHTRY